MSDAAAGFASSVLDGILGCFGCLCNIASRYGSSDRGTDVSSERALICFMACLSLSLGPGLSVTGFAIP